MNKDSQKLQKILAIQGLGSRREIERYIQAGRITVNNQIAYLGIRIKAEDCIQFDKKNISIPAHSFEKPSIRDHQPLVLYYKAAGEMCTRHDPQGRPTVFERLHSILPNQPLTRWIMVGRLDFNTMGLLLFTTEGELAHRLLHPRYGIEREYAVRVHGRVTQAVLTRLKAGVQFKEGDFGAFSSIQEKVITSPDLLRNQYSARNLGKTLDEKRSLLKVNEHRSTSLTTSSGTRPLFAKGLPFKNPNLDRKTGTNHWYHVVLKEGKYREVRRLWASEGITVSRLIRVRFGSIYLPQDLKPGQCRTLSKAAIQTLSASVDLIRT